MQSAASASAPSTIVIGAALLPANDSRAEVALAALQRSRYQQSALPAATSPSPPMSTCRRLSYDSAMMSSSSPSRTPASPSSTASSRSRSCPLSQQPQHFWQKRAPITEATTTTVSRRSTAAVGRAGVAATDTCVQLDDSSPVSRAHSPSTSIDSAAAPSSPEVAAGAHEQRLPEAAAAAAVTVATSLDACAGGSGNEGGEARPPSAVTVLQVTTAAVAMKRGTSARVNGSSSLSSAAASPNAAAPRPLPARRQSAKAITPPSNCMLIVQPQPQRAAPPPQPRRSRSANSGVRGAGTHTNSVCFQPVPTLRNVGTGGPSPFSAEQLAMPRRPPSRLAVVTAGDGVSWTGCVQRESATATVAATTMTAAHQRAPHVQLVRPADLCRSAAIAAGGSGTASTAMAASLMPGAAAAQDRLQLPHRSRLVRTPSATAAQPRRRTPSAGGLGGGGSARNAASSTPRKRRASTSPPGVAAEAPVEGSNTRLASRRPRSSTPSGTFSVYTTRGASSGRSPQRRSERLIPDDGATGDAAALRKGAARSSSAPVHGQRRASSRSRISSAAPGSVSSRALRVSNGLGASAVAPPSLVRSVSVTSVHQRLRRVTIAPVSTAATRSPASTAELVDFVRMSSVPHRSRSRDGTSGTSRSNTSAKSALNPLLAAAPSMTDRVPNTSTASAARRVNAGSTRPTTSTAGAGGPRVRPVLSMGTRAAAAAAAAPTATSTVSRQRHLADRKLRDGGSSNTVWASESSMISVKESKAFLEEFQRMNERELALFGTLLATVATERQKRSGHGIRGNAASNADKADATRLTGNAAGGRDAGLAPPTGVIMSAEDVTIWACKRTTSPPSHHQQRQQQASDVPQRKTPGEPAVVTPPASHPDEELIVLVRPSRSRSTGPHVPPVASTSGSEARQLPNQLAQRAERDEEKDNGHVPATSHAFARSPPHGQYHQQQPQCIGAGTAAGGRSSGDGAVLPRASRSPSPAPLPPVSATHRKENDQQAPSLSSVRRSPIPGFPLWTPAGARGPQQQQPGAFANARAYMSVSGGLRPREPTAVNTSANCTAAGAARKLSVVAMAAGTVVRGTVPDRPSASATSRVRRGGRRRCSANDGTDTSLSPPEEQWRRSVKSYTDIIRSYTPNRLEESHDGNSGNDCGANVRQSGVRLDEDPDVVDASALSPSSAVSEAAAPLTALKRAKEMAAEMAAAARAKTLAAEKLSTAMTAPSSLPPSAITADSPTRGSASGDCTAAAATEMCGVRVTTAQLQLLIESSRSQANYARYRQF
ncbi:hypothetical protein GH5_07990 [Leishmania sp. Ghana 2012 LV757]|uniref:hypothetical protein n=1 Tax=Leishmania sp. Ghana 2012 LV757 TaxID=2803181 RepID=UPI001B7179CE|nr:hypothetical protein GH5_07990 [Leishmania sp. Ghana 2012 LV757]